MGWTVTAVFFVLYTVVSVLRNDRMLNAGYDLGIFEQAIRAYAHGRAPIVELKGPGFHLLGDHFHPILVFVAPFYRLFPSGVTLLVVQAALMALACFPLTRWAHRAIGPVTGLVVGCGLGASWGLVAGVAKDFHEICFAVPLLAFSVTALGQRRWGVAAAWALPLLLVKEDLGLTLAAIGGYIAWQGLRERRHNSLKRSGHSRERSHQPKNRRHDPGDRPHDPAERRHDPGDPAYHPGERRRLPVLLGVGVAFLGVAGTSVEILVLLPAMNPRGGFDYWHQMPGEASSSGSLAGLASAGLHLLWPPMKWLLLFMLAAPTAFLGLRSPLTLLCVPTLAWRLLAGNEHYWQPNFHYNAILMPLVFAGLIDVLHRRPDVVPPRRRRKALAFTAAFTAVTAAVYPLHDLVLPSAWRTPAHVRTAERLLSRIPDGDTVASSNRLAPMLTGRTTVSLVCFGTGTGTGAGPDPAAPTGLPAHPPRWVVSDRHDPTVKTPCPVDQTHRMLRLYRAHGYVQVAEEDGITLLRRP